MYSVLSRPKDDALNFINNKDSCLAGVMVRYGYACFELVPN